MGDFDEEEICMKQRKLAKRGHTAHTIVAMWPDISGADLSAGIEPFKSKAEIIATHCDHAWNPLLIFARFNLYSPPPPQPKK